MAGGTHGYPIAKELQKALHESLGASSKAKPPHPTIMEVSEWDSMTFDEKVAFNASKGMKAPLSPEDPDLINVTSIGDSHKQWLNPVTGEKTQGTEIDIHASGELKVPEDYDSVEYINKQLNMEMQQDTEQQKIEEEGHYFQEKFQNEIIKGMAISQDKLVGDAMSTAIDKKPVDTGQMVQKTISAIQAMEKKKSKFDPLINLNYEPYLHQGVDFGKAPDKAEMWAAVTDPNGKYMKMELNKPDPQYYQMSIVPEEWEYNPELKAKYTSDSVHKFPDSPLKWKLIEITYDALTLLYHLKFIETGSFATPHDYGKKTSEWKESKANPVWGSGWAAEPLEPLPPIEIVTGTVKAHEHTHLSEKLDTLEKSLMSERDKVFSGIGK